MIQTKKKTEEVKKRRMRLLYICIFVLSIAITTGCLVYIAKAFVGAPDLEATNRAVHALRDELQESQRRIDSLDERVQKEAKRIRAAEQAVVDAMPSDAIADALSTELRKFLAEE